jgi:hypothetical protein
MSKEEQHLTDDSALDVQRYAFGLMTPDEEVAFEHGLAKSPETVRDLYLLKSCKRNACSPEAAKNKSFGKSFGIRDGPVEV